MSLQSVVSTVISTVVGGVVGGLLGYILSIKSKPSFRYIGITGTPRTIPCQNQTGIQCAIRYEIRYKKFGEKFVARNSRGWLAITGEGSIRLHNAPAPWAIAPPSFSVDIVGEESLILFTLMQRNNGYLVLIPFEQIPGIAFRCLRYGNPSDRCGFQCDDELRDNDRIEIRVAAENAHGNISTWRAQDVISKCLQSFQQNGRIVE